jgi:tetratricopeptide (TPR) repeat protein
MIAIPDKLKLAIQKNKLVIFVGAGLSVNLKNQQDQNLGNWTNLVKQIIGHLNGSSNKYDYLLQSLHHHEPIEVLRLIQQSKDIEKKDIYDFVKGFFGLQPDNDYALHKKITQLCNIIITTNYDTAFEESTAHLKNRVAYKGRNYELTTHKDDKPLLFKLHGCISDAESMVLFPRNYDDLYVNEARDAQHALAVLKSLVLNKSILFIGCGMGDFQINHIFKAIKDMQDGFGQPHFIVSKDRLDSSLGFLTPVTIEEHAEIGNILGLLLDIKEAAENERNKERVEQQKQIEDLKNKLTTIESKHEKLIEELFEEAIEFYNDGAFEKAARKYEQIAGLEPLSIVFNNWGSALHSLAKSKGGAVSEALYGEAIEKYRQAIAIQPDYHEAFYNFGLALNSLAVRKVSVAADALYSEAIDKYGQAIAIKPDAYQAFNDWGVALYNLGDSKCGVAADALYGEAIEKYSQAIAIQPSYYKAFYNWGLTLYSLAGSKGGVAAEALYGEAIEKYGQAIAIKPDYHKALDNWALALVKLAGIKEGAAAEVLYGEAEVICLKAVELGGGCYNLACFYALQNKKADALHYLDMSLIKGEISISHINEDTDWEEYRQDADFIALLDKYRK